MARIDQYATDASLSGEEIILGSDKGVVLNYRLTKVADYILGVGGDRKIPIKSQSDLTTIIPTNIEGTRYINTVTGSSAYMGIDVTAGYIYELLDGVWYEMIPSEGFNVWDKEVSKNFYFDGSTWLEMLVITLMRFG